MKDLLTGKKIPKLIYKYRNFETNINYKNHFELLNDGLVYLAKPNDFNDPFDCQIPINYDEFIQDPNALTNYITQEFKKNPQRFVSTNLETAISNAKIGNLSDPVFVKNYKNHMINHLNESFGVLSLSKEYDNINLWSHYSYGHTGFCFGINTKKLLELYTIDGSISPVNYLSNYPIISPLDDGIGALKVQLFSKSKSWSTEKEYRLIMTGFGGKTLDISETIENIYLGCKISEDNRKRIKDLMKTKYGNVKGFNMEIAENRFGLVPIPWKNYA